MKALLSHTPEGPSALAIGDLPEPIPDAGEILVRVRACGLNYPDLLMIQDKYQLKPPRPFVPGGEIAGEVLRVGEGVTDIAVGDRIMAFVGLGGLAEQATVPRAKCIPVPVAMPFSIAAAFLTTFGTSYHALKQRARLQAGESLLVLGASGGVGLAAVMLGHAMGARVIAAASSEAKVELARRYGADEGVIYPAAVTAGDVKSLSAALKQVVGRKGIDIAYDAVGGFYAEATLRAMAWRGRFLVVGFPAGIPTVPLNLTLLKGCEIAGVWYGEFTEREPEANDENNRELFALYEAGKIDPYISATFSMEDAADGFELLASRNAQGKIVVEIG